MTPRFFLFFHLVLAGLLTFASTPRLTAQPASPWNGLTPGPHAVGFRSSWHFDHARRYNMVFADKTSFAKEKSPRPILVNVWYPAKPAADGNAAKKMLHRDYLDIRSDDPRLTPFSALLSQYELAVIAKELIDKTADQLTADEKKQLDMTLGASTAAVRNAPQAQGRFPVVIYHSGAGSSFEDNAVFCEFLASHGFLVLGSAFQDQSGKSFNTDNREGSLGDFAFLIALTQTLPGADWNHIGIVGHSAGAQAALKYGSQAECAADAIVSLDTTQDYHSVTDPFWEDLTRQVIKNKHQFRSPLLMAAGSSAFFELGDMLKASHRYYLTFQHLDHNDYISQGGMSRDLMLRLNANQTDQKGLAKDRLAKDKAAEDYRALCLYTLRFLEAQLKSDPAATPFLAKQYRNASPDGASPRVEEVAPTITGPEPYREESARPPTPRQFRRYLREQGSAKAIALLKRWRKEEAAQALTHSNAELYLVNDLLDQGKADDAVAFREYFRESGPEHDHGLTLWKIGNGFERIGRTKWAAIYFKRLVALEPNHREAAAKLKKLEAKLAKEEAP